MRGEDGFSLVEAVVAAGLMAGAFASLAQVVDCTRNQFLARTSLSINQNS